MDAEQVAALRALLAPSGWLERTVALARALRRPRSPGGLLVVGTPDDEPWHLTAHLDEESPAGQPARAEPHPGPLGAAPLAKHCDASLACPAAVAMITS